MLHSEEIQVQDLITRTTQVLRRASAGPDDIGSRYSRLLELLWKPKSLPATSSSSSSTLRPQQATTCTTTDLQIQKNPSSPNPIPDHDPTNSYVHFSPANDFSWLDLEAVSDFVSGDQIPGAGGMLEPDIFRNLELYNSNQTGQDGSQSWLTPTWFGDTTSNLLF